MTTTLYDQLERRILLLDGGFGTMVQGYGLQEEDYRGRRFAGWPVQLKGCNDLLALTRPDRWVPRTARPRCRPTYRIPRPAR